MLQDILEIPVDEVRVGMRVEAVWLPREARRSTRSTTAPGAAPPGLILGWRPPVSPTFPRTSSSDKVF